MKEKSAEETQINIDPEAGFCFGVVRAINVLDKELNEKDELYCLGDVVHNQEEINRLSDRGLKIINVEELKKLKNIKVVFRAHGEPQRTYDIARRNNIDIIDSTCPIVLQLQKKIKTNYKEVKENNGQIVIYGKAEHPEVIGLNGQTDNNAIVIENENDLDKINFDKPIRLFSQTTRSVERYQRIIEEIKKRKDKSNDDYDSGLRIYDTICRKVSNRAKHIVDFARKNSLVIFVSDKKSSNGKYLFKICKSVNINCYFISEPSEIKKEWLKNVKTVGISGATSTPGWLMEKVEKRIKSLLELKTRNQKPNVPE